MRLVDVINIVWWIIHTSLLVLGCWKYLELTGVL